MTIETPTRIYGTSDDLIEVTGIGETSFNGSKDKGTLIICSDGTIVEMKYGKEGKAIWGARLIQAGILYDGTERCNDEDAEIYSDIVHFVEDLKWAYAASRWEKVE